MNAPLNNLVALQSILAPLQVYYRDNDLVEVHINRPGEVILDRRGCEKMRIEAGELTLAVIEHMCQSLANFNGLHFDASRQTKLSCVLPEGHRFECVVGHSSQSQISLTIRCKHPFAPAWDHLGADERIRDYLLEAVAQEKNIIVSGATNTGKTTLMNMLLEVIEPHKRVIVVEDTPELHIDRFWDGVGILVDRDDREGQGLLTYREVYDHIMRSTPDHVIFGEISTRNSYAAIAIMNAGITGFMCSVHASNPREVLKRKFKQNIMWSGNNVEGVEELLCENVDVIVQIKRDSNNNRSLSDIYLPKETRFHLIKEGVKL